MSARTHSCRHRRFLRSILPATLWHSFSSLGAQFRTLQPRFLPHPSPCSFAAAEYSVRSRIKAIRSSLPLYILPGPSPTGNPPKTQADSVNLPHIGRQVTFVVPQSISFPLSLLAFREVARLSTGPTARMVPGFPSYSSFFFSVTRRN